MNLLYANDRPGEHAPSWYQHSCDTPTHPTLESHLDTDVCIVGAGFTGLSAALELRLQGTDCAVLEAHRVGWGASGRNGGQLGTGFNMDQMELEALVGPVLARQLWEIAEKAKLWILETCQQYAINIDYRPGIVYAQHRQRLVKPLHTYCEYLRKHYDYSEMLPLNSGTIRQHVNSLDYHGGAVDRGAGHIHPLKLALGLAAAASSAGADIFERSEVIRVQKKAGGRVLRVITSTGSITCRRVILATNGYGDTLNAQIANTENANAQIANAKNANAKNSNAQNTQLQQRLMPINNFIVVTEPLGDLAGHLLPADEAVADSRFVVNYFRRVANDRLLFGGGENYSYRFPDRIATLVRKAMLGIFPELQSAAVDFAWGGTLAITRNRLPFIGEISPQQFAAGGYSGHGVALACIYGKALADHMAGNSEMYTVLGQLPNQPFPGGVRSRPALLAAAMSGYSLLDKL